jgi:hypothetical protein
MKLGIPKRFSLRFFLMGSLVAGTFLGFLLPEIHRRSLIARIEQHGGVVQYDAGIQEYWKSNKVTKITNPSLDYRLESSDLFAFPHLREIGFGDVTSDLGMTGEFVMDVDAYQNVLLRIASKDQR